LVAFESRASPESHWPKVLNVSPFGPPRAAASDRRCTSRRVLAASALPGAGAEALQDVVVGNRQVVRAHRPDLREERPVEQGHAVVVERLEPRAAAPARSLEARASGNR
jgi:hypothetical protein